MKSPSGWSVVVVGLAVWAPMADAAPVTCPASLPAGVVIRVFPDEKLVAGIASGPTIFTVGSDVRFFPNRPPLLARGSKVLGNIVESKQAGRFHGRAQMRIALTSILTADFCEYPIDSKIVEVARHTVKNDIVVGRGHAKRDVIALLFPPTTIYQLLRIPSRGPKLELSTETALTIKLLQPLSLAAASSGQSESGRPAALRSGADPSGREAAVNAVSGACSTMQNTAVPARPVVRRTTIDRPIRNLTPYHVSVYLDRTPVAIVPPCYGGSMITTPINEFTLEASASLPTTGGQKQVNVKVVPSGGGWDIVPDAAEQFLLTGASVAN
jgi:hypothetical protein